MDRDVQDWSRDDEYFAENVRLRREELGWSQGEFSRRLREAGLDHMHQTTVSRLEKGQRPPRVGEARGIAAVLKVTVPYLIAPPEGVRIWTRLAQDINDLEGQYDAVTSAAERLHLARLVLEGDLSSTRDYQAEGWYADNVQAVRKRAQAALKWLTVDHAVEDRNRDDEEMYFEQYRQES